jgi:AraC-like DNA-binding protein
MHMIGFIKGMTSADTSRRSTRIAEPTIAAPFARALLELAVAKGAGRRELLERSGIDEGALDDRQARIPLARWVALMRFGAQACGDAALPLHFGEAFDVGDMSVVGLMTRAAGTKGEALTMVNRFCRLVADVPTEGDERFQLVREGRRTWMVDTRLDPNETPEVSETGFAQMATMGQRMLPGVLHFRAVHFTHPAPAYRAEYERIFQVPVVFGSDRNAFLMPDGWEADPIALQPRYALDILEAHAERLLERLDSEASVTLRVEALLAPRLASGQTGAAAVAAALGLSQQGLYRKLKAEGVTFVEVLRAVRRRLANHYLRDKGLSAKETGYRLGFSDPAAFSRAFKRWTGSTPSAFRREQGGDR